jgi:glycosyltransferase involved in cell wall biosynthesis
VKITCIIHSLDGGGAERVMAALSSQLADRDHQVTLITLDDGSRDRHTVNSKVLRRALNVMSESGSLVTRLRRMRQRTLSLRTAIAESNPDVVLSFCDRTNILTLLATGPLSLPVVISERSDPTMQNLGNVWEWLRVRTYRRATKIIALTPESAKHLRAIAGKEVQVIPSAVNVPPESVTNSTRVEADNNHRILAIGRLEHEKGFDRLIYAFAPIAAKDIEASGQRVGAEQKAWSLRILGEGSQREQLEQQARAVGLADRIEFPGWVKNVWEELSQATMFVLPSRYEGFPSALLEAMAAGVPSIAVDCESGPRAVINDSQCGLLVENNKQALTEAMQTMIDDPERRIQMGLSGKNVIERFGWNAMTSAYEDVLRDAVHNKPAR